MHVERHADLVVMLLLSNVVQNAVIGPDNSLTGGLLGALVLVVFNAVVVRGSLTSERLHRLLEGTSTVLASHGQWDSKALRHEGLRRADVDAALRRQNANDVSETERVSIEPGRAVVATLSPGEQSATRRTWSDWRPSSTPCWKAAGPVRCPASIQAHTTGRRHAGVS